MDDAILHGKPFGNSFINYYGETTENVSKSKDEMSNSQNNRQLKIQKQKRKFDYKIEIVQQYHFVAILYM